MSQQTSWTDDNEHTLDMIRLNSVNLSERHYAKYQKYKRRLNYVKYPVIVMSAANAYAAIGLPLYLNQKYVSIGNTTVSFLVVIIVLLDIFMGTQNKLERELSKHVEFKQLGQQIFDVLSLDRIERKLDPVLFLDMKYKVYEVLADANDRIQKFKDVVLSQSEKFITSPIINKDDPIVQKLHRHWNILFQPVTFKLQGRKKDIESLDVVTTEEPNSDNTVEMTNIYEKTEKHLFSNFFRNPFQKIEEVKNEDEEALAEEKKEMEEKNEKELQENPQVVVREKREPTSPEVKSNKGFGMNFMAKK